jgi:hypothetical protein
VVLQTTASPAATAAAWTYLGLLEQADELCRTGILLTPSPRPRPVAAALVREAAGRPGSRRRPTGSGEDVQLRADEENAAGR